MRVSLGVIVLALFPVVGLFVPPGRADLLEQQRKLEILSLKIPENLNFSRTLKGKLFQVSYEPEPLRGSVALVNVPLREIHAWRVAVLDQGGRPVRRAKIGIEGTMPQHSHPLSTLPTVKELSPGIYLVSGLKFHMPGWWVVTISVEAGAKEESFAFNLMLQDPGSGPGPGSVSGADQVPASVSREWTLAEKGLLRDLWIGSLRELSASDFPSNAFALNSDAQELGSALFHDSSLSKDGKNSCASCHLPEHGMAGSHVVDVRGQGPRKPPSLLGVAWQSWFFWDGRKDSLWSQALGPIEGPGEIEMPRAKWKKRVAKKYGKQYTALFGKIPPDTRAGINEFFVNTGKAIAAYETTLRPGPSAFDRYVEHVLGLTPVPGPQGGELSACALTGLRVFIGKGRCVNCHHGPRFENGSFQSTGILPVAADDEQGGRIHGIETASKDPFSCRGRFGPKKDADQSCSELDHALRNTALIGNAFKTPTLRNVEVSGPYMHNGRLPSLEAVVDHYVTAYAPPGGSEILPFQANADDRAGLVCFLKALTSLPEVK
jgi:cytochrome c peroxidase